MNAHVIAGRYRPIEQLGRGGMGVVWRVQDERLGRVVALKVLHPWVADDPELRDRFEREASALGTPRAPERRPALRRARGPGSNRPRDGARRGRAPGGASHDRPSELGRVSAALRSNRGGSRSRARARCRPSGSHTGQRPRGARQRPARRDRLRPCATRALLPQRADLRSPRRDAGVLGAGTGGG